MKKVILFPAGIIIALLTAGYYFSACKKTSEAITVSSQRIIEINKYDLDSLFQNKSVFKYAGNLIPEINYYSTEEDYSYKHTFSYAGIIIKEENTYLKGNTLTGRIQASIISHMKKAMETTDSSKKHLGRFWCQVCQYQCL